MTIEEATVECERRWPWRDGCGGFCWYDIARRPIFFYWGGVPEGESPNPGHFDPDLHKCVVGIVRSDGKVLSYATWFESRGFGVTWEDALAMADRALSVQWDPGRS